MLLLEAHPGMLLDPTLAFSNRVLKSGPVQFFCYFWGNCNQDWSFFSGNFIRLDQDHKRPVACGLWQLCNWLKPVVNWTWLPTSPNQLKPVETTVIIIAYICNQFFTTLTSLSDSETQKTLETTEYSIYKPLSSPALRLVLFGDLFGDLFSNA